MQNIKENDLRLVHCSTGEQMIIKLGGQKDFPPRVLNPAELPGSLRPLSCLQSLRKLSKRAGFCLKPPSCI